MRVRGKDWLRGGTVALLSMALAACGSTWSGGGLANGVPLDELDLGGTPPTAVGLGGPDNVIVTTGPAFTVRAEGPAATTDRLRFAREGGSLEIGRAPDADGGGPPATVHVTLPAIHALALSGSGDLSSDSLTGEARLSLSGSGNLATRQVAASQLRVSVAGSGNVAASGRAEALNLSIAGSGSVAMPGLEVADAKVSISGSGDAAFASNGTVSASIAGSGDVRVRGSATCTQSHAGSGRLTCTP